MSETKKIGNKIAEARKRVNISQARLADRLFVSPQAVGKWERGESMPDITTFNRMAEILGVDLNYFSDGFPHKAGEISHDEHFAEQFEVLPADERIIKPDWNFSHSNWVDADFSELKNLHEKFSSSNMQRCRFNGSDLSGLSLKSNNVNSCDFTGSDISHSHIQSSNLADNIFIDCRMAETGFSQSNIGGCDFSGASLAGAAFSETFISGCNFSGADFTGAVIRSGGISGKEVKSGDPEINSTEKTVWMRTSFIDTRIADICFEGTLEDCSFENCAFTRVTFRNATLVNTFFKNNKRLKRISFVNCKADRMTYEFLKQGKADLTGITLSMQTDH